MLVFIKYQAFPEVPPVWTVDCPGYRINYTDIRGIGTGILLFGSFSDNRFVKNINSSGWNYGQNLLKVYNNINQWLKVYVWCYKVHILTAQSLIVLKHLFYMLPEIYANQLCVEFLGKLNTAEFHISQEFYTFPKQKSKIC